MQNAGRIESGMGDVSSCVESRYCDKADGARCGGYDIPRRSQDRKRHAKGGGGCGDHNASRGVDAAIAELKLACDKTSAEQLCGFRKFSDAVTAAVRAANDTIVAAQRAHYDAHSSSYENT